MWKKVLALGVRRFVGSPGSAWIFTTAAFSFFSFVRNQFGRRQLIDLSNTRPGDTIVIEHLFETHKQQIKGERTVNRQERKLKRQAKQANRTAKKIVRKERSEERGVAREARRANKAAKSAARAAKKSDRIANRADRLQRRADKVRSKAGE